jgi:hypothetical protein
LLRGVIALLRGPSSSTHAIEGLYARLFAQGLLTRTHMPGVGRTPTWRYTPQYTSRGELLAGVVEQMCANRGDRALALALLLGTPQ